VSHTETARALELRELCERHGQGHVFRAWDQLDEAARGRLLSQVAGLDLELVDHLRSLIDGPEAHPASQRIEPPDVFPLERGPDEKRRAREAVERGEELLRAGKVGYLTVAGGQASRLGYDGPKGTFPVGPVTDRSLFELLAHRLVAARERYGARTPWYVMTSPANDADTRAFFEEHGTFGLEAEDLFFFAQGMNPALDRQGRILMQGPDRLFLAPDGHGGVLLALARSGGLDHARERGIEQLSYFQVDNPLVRPADPLFIGLHAGAGAGMSAKAVSKRDAAEKVGVLGRVDGKMGCIEYSDLPGEQREARDAEGRLLFRAGNIAVHVLALEFVEEVTRGDLELPWHLARKSMRVFQDGAEREVEGVKFETFVFDALERSPASVILEVERSREFSPVKNAQGQDSPATTRRDLCALFAGWVEAAGLPLPEPDAEGVRPLEVDPVLAEDREGFLARLPLEPRRSERGHLYE